MIVDFYRDDNGLIINCQAQREPIIIERSDKYDRNVVTKSKKNKNKNKNIDKNKNELEGIDMKGTRRRESRMSDKSDESDKSDHTDSNSDISNLSQLSHHDEQDRNNDDDMRDDMRDDMHGDGEILEKRAVNLNDLFANEKEKLRTSLKQQQNENGILNSSNISNISNNSSSMTTNTNTTNSNNSSKIPFYQINPSLRDEAFDFGLNLQRGSIVNDNYHSNSNYNSNNETNNRSSNNEMEYKFGNNSKYTRKKERKYSKDKNYYFKAKKEFKKMNEKLDSMSKEINNLRYSKVQLSQECQRLSKINSDLVDRILVLDHDLEQLKAQMAAKLNGEYVALITKRPIGLDWTVANEQLKVATVDSTSGAQLFNVESGDVLLSVNNYDVSNMADSKRIRQWLDATPLPIFLTFCKKEARLELERANYLLEKERKELLERLNHKQKQKQRENESVTNESSDDTNDDDDDDNDNSSSDEGSSSDSDNDDNGSERGRRGRARGNGDDEPFGGELVLKNLKDDDSDVLRRLSLRRGSVATIGTVGSSGMTPITTNDNSINGIGMNGINMNGVNLNNPDGTGQDEIDAYAIEMELERLKKCSQDTENQKENEKQNIQTQNQRYNENRRPSLTGQNVFPLSNIQYQYGNQNVHQNRIGNQVQMQTPTQMQHVEYSRLNHQNQYNYNQLQAQRTPLGGITPRNLNSNPHRNQNQNQSLWKGVSQVAPVMNGPNRQTQTLAQIQAQGQIETGFGIAGSESLSNQLREAQASIEQVTQSKIDEEKEEGSADNNSNNSNKSSTSIKDSKSSKTIKNDANDKNDKTGDDDTNDRSDGSNASAGNKASNASNKDKSENMFANDPLTGFDFSIGLNVAESLQGINTAKAMMSTRTEKMQENIIAKTVNTVTTPVQAIHPMERIINSVQTPRVRIPAGYGSGIQSNMQVGSRARMRGQSMRMPAGYGNSGVQAMQGMQGMAAMVGMQSMQGMQGVQSLNNMPQRTRHSMQNGMGQGYPMQSRVQHGMQQPMQQPTQQAMQQGMQQRGMQQGRHHGMISGAMDARQRSQSQYVGYGANINTNGNARNNKPAPPRRPPPRRRAPTTAPPKTNSQNKTENKSTKKFSFFR